MSHAHKGGFPRPAQRTSTCHQKLGKSKQLLKHLRDTLSSERTDQSAPARLRCTIRSAEMLTITAEVTEKTFTARKTRSKTVEHMPQSLARDRRMGSSAIPEMLSSSTGIVAPEAANAGTAIAVMPGSTSVKSSAK